MLSPAELRRYARHTLLPELGQEGQEKLKNSSVLCLGAGGLGSPAAMYLAAAGVGRLGLVDADVVEESNLQRQLLHGTTDVGRKKVESARDRLRAINPHVELEIHDTAFQAGNARGLAENYGLILDGTDNFPTRYLSNDVAVWQKKPNVYGSIHRFEGQCSVFAPHLGGPCYRCLFPQPPPPGAVPSCAEAGVLGALPGIVGTFQALEAIKLLTGIGEPLIGKLLHVDTLTMNFRTFKLRRDPQCPVCGENPTLFEPVDYHAFCGVPAQEAPPLSPVDEITVAQLAGVWPGSGADGAWLIDVREPAEHAAACIPGARLMPLGSLPAALADIPRGQPLILHCQSGRRSATALHKLQAEGFTRVRHLAGGIAAWQALENRENLF